MDLRCLHTGIFIKAPSLKGLPTKAKEDPSPHEMRLSPVFPGLGKIIIIIIIIVIVVIIITIIIIIIIIFNLFIVDNK